MYFYVSKLFLFRYDKGVMSDIDMSDGDSSGEEEEFFHDNGEEDGGEKPEELVDDDEEIDLTRMKMRLRLMLKMSHLPLLKLTIIRNQGLLGKILNCSHLQELPQVMFGNMLASEKDLMES